MTDNERKVTELIVQDRCKFCFTPRKFYPGILSLINLCDPDSIPNVIKKLNSDLASCDGPTTSDTDAIFVPTHDQNYDQDSYVWPKTFSRCPLAIEEAGANVVVLDNSLQTD